MNRLAIESYIRKLNLNASVCALNEMTFSNTPMIVNTEPSHMPGRHWIVVDVANSELFDSIANINVMIESFEPFMLRYNDTYMYNVFRVQDTHSSSCGLYCLYYLLYRKNNTFQQTIRHFMTRTPECNHNFLLSYFLNTII